ncbi:MAG: hypothetical protein AAGE52_34375 [Myxococcota bacterium]
MVATLARSSEPLLEETWKALYALDPARFDRSKTSALRDSLRNVHSRLDALPKAEGPLPDALATLRNTLSDVPESDEPESWMELRSSLEPCYEEVAEHLLETGVKVPRLRPTNYTRSIVHALSGLAVVAFVELAPRQVILWTASCALVVAVFLESTRRFSPWWNDMLMKVLGPVAHPYERYRINSASNYIAALFILAWMGYPAVGAVGVIVLALADPAASFVGRRWGTTPLLNGRTLQGSLAFVVMGTAAALVVLTIFHGEISIGSAAIIAAVAAFAAAVAELASGRLDDNLTIPVIAGAAAWGVAVLLGAPLASFV